MEINFKRNCPTCHNELYYSSNGKLKRANEENITDLQHAENGGEYHIKELGYFVDGYSKEKNIVIEYYEKFHYSESKIKRDLKRQQEIVNVLKCEFINIKE